MATSTIEEWLVSLGLKLDQEAFKKGKEAITQFSEAITKIGGILATTATAVEAAMLRITKQMEELYYQAQMSGTTVQALQALGYAAQQIGLDAESLQGAAKNLYMALQTRPGLEQMMQGMGVHTRDMFGNLKGSDKLLVDFIDHIKNLPFALQVNLAQQFGISPEQLMATEKNLDKLKAAIADYDRRVLDAGVNTKQYAEDSEALWDALGQALSEVHVILMQIGADWAPMALPIVKWFEHMLELLSNFNSGLTGWQRSLVLGLEGFIAMAVPITGVTAMLGGLPTLLAGVGLAFDALGAVIAIATGPIGLAIAAIAIGAYEVWKNWDWLMEKFKWLWASLKSDFAEFSNDPEGPKKLGKASVGPIEEAWDAFWDFMTKPRPEWIQGLHDWNAGIWASLGLPIDGVKTSWSGFWTWFEDWANKVQDYLLTVGDQIARDMGARAVAQLKLAWDGLTYWFHKLGGDIVDNLWAGIQSNWDSLVQKFHDAWNALNPFSSAPDTGAAPGGGTAPAPGGGRFSGGMFHPASYIVGGDGGGGGGFGGGTSASWGGKTSSDAAKTVMGFLKMAGYSGAQAAGVLGNLIEESNLNPRAYNAREGAFGIAQWRGDRLAGLEAFAKQPGENLYSLPTQLKYLFTELTQNQSFGNALLKAQNTAAGAAAIFDQYFERSAGTTRFAREGLAQKYFGMLGDQPLTTQGPGGGLQSASINQKTDIHITGGGDPHETARQVAAAQSRVNGDMIRSFASALDGAHSYA